MPQFTMPFLPSFADLLDLEELDKNLYRGINEYPDTGRHTLYGGQVAAQALKAAGMTVSPDRHPHSLHGYFLRAGQRDRPVIFEVARDRDGRSFSARRVSAIQDGEVIFDLAASFHVERPGAELTIPTPSVAHPPEACSLDPYGPNVPSADARPVPPLMTDSFGNDSSHQLWIRMFDPLPDDRLSQACALTYMSDIGTGFAETAPQGLPTGGSSLDHALWFRTPVRADEWCLIDLRPLMAGGSRGLYNGTIHSADGRLAAVLTQELLLVDPSPSRAN